MTSSGPVEAALEALVPIVDGEVSDGRLRGSYGRHGVEAWTTEQRPGFGRRDGLVTGPRMNIFHVELTGVGGRHGWECRSGLTPLANLAIVLPWRLVYAYAPR